MNEEWIEIQGNREIYEISNFGNVRTKTRQGARGHVVKGHSIKQRNNSNGYLRCSMNLGNGSKEYLVHRLVAQYFVENPHGKQYVNHIDGNKHNNRADNLEWCTKSENELHAHKIGLKKTTPLKGEMHGGRVFDWKDVRNIRKEYIKGDREHGQCALARKYNTSQSHIYNIVNNKNWIEDFGVK